MTKSKKSSSLMSYAGTFGALVIALCSSGDRFAELL